MIDTDEETIIIEKLAKEIVAEMDNEIDKIFNIKDKSLSKFIIDSYKEFPSYTDYREYGYVKCKFKEAGIIWKMMNYPNILKSKLDYKFVLVLLKSIFNLYKIYDK